MKKFIFLLFFLSVLAVAQTDESPVYISWKINSTLAGTPVMHAVRWKDDIGLSGYIFSFDNCTGHFINDSWVPFKNQLEDWSNVTKIINSTVGCKIRWVVYANDTSNQWNVTKIFEYYTSGRKREFKLFSHCLKLPFLVLEIGGSLKFKVVKICIGI